ncbi:MAG: LTA synthase family protein [Paludibacteraceae bacterium]|nr:LTA synthase family protein [Paludibacteraceae bacterium]
MDKWHNIKECGKFILKSHLSFLLMCMVIRITGIITCSHLMLEESRNDYAKITEGILRGIVFDNAVSAIFLLLPILVLGLFCSFGIIKKSILNVFAIIIGILYALSVAVSVGNIPYLTYKMANVCLADLSYLSKPGEMFGMLTGEPLYLAFFITGWILIAAIIYIIWRFAKAANIKESKQSSFSWQVLVATLLAFVVCFLMGRGNNPPTNKKGAIFGRPLTFIFAIYSDDAFLNLSAQSPTFGLIKEMSHLGRKIKTGINNDEAIAYANNIRNKTIASLADTCAKKKNVVMIIMESLSANYMSTFGNQSGLTPCLDSLFANSHAFYNAWSNGARTNNAIFSTQTSLPGCLNINMLETPLSKDHTSLAPVLSANGYSTDFFISHAKTFDNISVFFVAQPFDKIHSEEEYGYREMEWGLRDSTLLAVALDSIRQLAKDTAKPFYSAILTCSNHPTFSIPSPYCEMYPEIEHCAVRYSDTSIDTFMRRASKEPWFDNTIFVFTGDHGRLVGTPDGVAATSLNHVPIFFYGKDIEPVKDSSLTMQIDLEPTILGMLGLQCPNFAGLGINRMKMKRDTAVYTSNNFFIARTADKAYFLNMETKSGTLYDLKEDFSLSNATIGNIPEFDRQIMLQIQSLYVIQDREK